MNIKKKIIPVISLSAATLLLAACSSGTETSVQEVAQPEPTSAASAPSEAGTPVEDSTSTESAPDVEPEVMPDVDLGVKEAKVGDFIGVAVPEGLLQAENPVTTWGYATEVTGVVSEPAPDAQPTGEFLTVGEESTDTFYVPFEVTEAGTGTILVSYTNPETGEVKNLSLTVNAS